MFATTESTAALLALEDASPDVLGEHVPGSPVALWPQVRMLFSVALAESELRTEAVSAGMTTWEMRKRLVRSHLPSRSDAAGLRGRMDTLFIVGGITVHDVEGRERNWLVDDFARSTGGSAAIAQWRPRGKRAPAFTPTRSLDALVARADLHARLHPLEDTQVMAVRALVAEFARKLDRALTSQQLESVIAQAVSLERIRRPIDQAFARILDHVAPGVVVMEDASYGARASLIRMMKERGVHVAEPQHGWVGPSHAAYNFGAVMREPEMLQTLPDTVLTFGSFWSDSIRHPAELVAVGKPHLEAQAVEAPALEERPHTVLVISSVADVEDASNFVFALQAGLPEGWLVRFRPHPSERAGHRERYAQLAARGVEFDLEDDVYRSMAAARAVVGVASTVLFEAVAMGCPVYVRESPYFEYYVGDTFGPAFDGVDGAAEIAAAIAAGPRMAPARIPQDMMWAPDSRATFAQWISSIHRPGRPRGMSRRDS